MKPPPRPSDRDIYASALLLVRKHGDGALLHATQRCDAMIEAGDPGGTAVWNRIVAAVEGLLSAPPQDGLRH